MLEKIGATNGVEEKGEILSTDIGFVYFTEIIKYLWMSLLPN